MEAVGQITCTFLAVIATVGTLVFLGMGVDRVFRASVALWTVLMSAYIITGALGATWFISTVIWGL